MLANKSHGINISFPIKCTEAGQNFLNKASFVLG